MDAVNGAIVVNRALNADDGSGGLEDGQMIELHVVATDHGVPPMTARETLFIVINRFVILVYTPINNK